MPPTRSVLSHNDQTKSQISLSKLLVRRPSKSMKQFKSQTTQPVIGNAKKKNLLTKFVDNRSLQNSVTENVCEESSSESEEWNEIGDNEEQQDIDGLILQDPEKVFEFIHNSDNESVSEEECDEYVEQIEVDSHFNFFSTFEEIPKLDKVSLDLTDDVTAQEAPSKFFNPLSVSYAEEITVPIGLPISEQSESSTDFMSVEFIDESDVPKLSAIVDDETILMFQEALEQSDAPDGEDKLDEKLMNYENIYVQEFLNKLINDCVVKVINFEDSILSISLDKRKLLTELMSKSNLLEEERWVSRFLNRKTLEYFKRKGDFRMLIPEDSTNLSAYRKRFYRALEDLDKLLMKEQRTKTLSSTYVHDLRHQFEEIKQVRDQERDELEQLIKTTFQRKNFDKLQASVKKCVSKMFSLRTEISEVRLRLLLQQDKFSALHKRLEILEDLGDGLNIHHFESVETETTTLGRKLDEHHHALKKLYTHMNSDLHKMAHLKEKHKMLKSIVAGQREYLGELIHEKKEMRKYLNHLKLKHKRLRQELLVRRFESGILLKPALLNDYDKTVEAANKLRQSNEDLKRTIGELTTKISILEQNCMEET